MSETIDVTPTWGEIGNVYRRMAAELAKQGFASSSRLWHLAG
jgi:hypothetical protein